MEGVCLAQGASWFDSHCHLQGEYTPDTGVAQVVSEAKAAGVNALVCVGTGVASSRQAVELADALSSGVSLGPGGVASGGEPGASIETWATVGLHPHEASSGTEKVAEVLEQAMSGSGSRVVAVGECGLDYHYDHSPRDAQRIAFAEQIALSKRYSLALVVHTREAWDDTFDILRSEGPPERIVFHCFTGGVVEAKACLDLGSYLSFSGIVTFKGADDVREAAAMCPSSRLLVETDSPFLAPVPHRGKPNRPAWVAEVGRFVAELRGVAPRELAASSTAAAREAFNLA